MIWLFFVAITTVVWVGHALNSNRNARIPVQVVYVGLPATVGTTDPLPEVVYAKVRDMGRRLRDVYMSQPQITIDLSDQIHSQDDEIVVTSDVIRHILADMLPGTCNIQDIEPQEIRTNYHHQRAKKVLVLPDVTIHPAAQYQASSKLKIVPHEVTAYGSQAALDSIKYIVTAPFSLTGARDSVDETLQLIAPEGIRLSTSEVNIHQAIELYTEKTIQVPIHVQGAPEGKHIHLFPSTAKVRIQIPMRRYQEINEQDVEVAVDYPYHHERELRVQVTTAPPQATHLSIQPQEVEYMIETIGSNE